MSTARPRLHPDDYKRAERAAAAKKERLTFPSVRACLGWYFEARERMQSPKGMHLRTEAANEGRADTRVLLRVDGGSGGDLDEVLATLATVTMALEKVQKAEAMGLLPKRSYQVLVLSYRDGLTQADIAAALQFRQQQASVMLGRAEDCLLGGLVGGVVGASRDEAHRAG